MLGWSPIDVLPEILMDVPDLVFAYTCDGRYLFMNAAAAMFLGVGSMDVIGRHWSEMGFPPEVMQPLVERVSTVATTGRPEHYRVHGSPQHDSETPVKAKAVLIDPDSLSVLWTSDAVIEGADAEQPASLEQAIPMSEMLGLSEALRTVAETGTPAHLSANLVSTGRGAVAYAVSVYRLPDGKLLVLSEHAWHVAEGKKPPTGAKRTHRRR